MGLGPAAGVGLFVLLCWWRFPVWICWLLCSVCGLDLGYLWIWVLDWCCCGVPRLVFVLVGFLVEFLQAFTFCRYLIWCLLLFIFLSGLLVCFSDFSGLVFAFWFEFD